MSLWKWNELCLAVSGQADEALSDPQDQSIKGISIDTRTLQAGDLFIALSGDPGPRFRPPGSEPADNPGDGHNFMEQALAAGAAAAMVHKPVESSLPVVQVDDTLDGLWRLARSAVRRSKAQRIAITGSSGKTTAKAFLTQLLADQGATHAALGSLNNHWGVPLSVARMPIETRFGIFEIGMNHSGEIAPLAELVQPEIALVLNVYPVHIGAFDDLESIRREKLSITQGLSPGGVLILPDELSAQGTDVPVLTFGKSDSASLRLLSMEPRADGKAGLLVQFEIDGQQWTFNTIFAGEHRVMTCLAVLAAIHALDADMNVACRGLENVQPPQGRGNQQLVSGIHIIDDSYNANPASVHYALTNMLKGRQSRAQSSGRKIAILGDILELGDQSQTLHAALLDSCSGIDKVIAVGPAMLQMYELLPEAKRWFAVDNADDIDIQQLAASLREGDEVLIKGSNKVFWLRNFVQRLMLALQGAD